MEKSEVVIVKQGWLLKRGEVIKNLRPRWFQLKSDGSFRGFKSGPPAPGDGPANLFEIAGSVLKVVDDGKPEGKGKKYGFLIRFMAMTQFIERMFFLEKKEERDEWILAYTDVKKKIIAQNAAKLMNSDLLKSQDKPHLQMSLDDFSLMKVLGKGSFGKVCLAQQKSTKHFFAIKILKKSVILQKDELVHTLTENAVLQRTEHPFLTGLKYAFQTPDVLCFVMEYVNGGELFFHLARAKTFTEERSKFYAMEITLALTYLHERGIIYRDLKLENLMLDREGHVKITDFGLCKEDISFGSTTTTFCGTPEYLAPEILDDQEYGRAVDWWGLGVVLHEMLTGKLPFYNRNHDMLFQLILHATLQLPSTLSSTSRDILLGLLTKNPSDRLGGRERDGHEVSEHRFFEGLDPQQVLAKKIPPPFVPQLSGEDDTKYFDAMFTSEAPQITPPDEDDVLAHEIVDYGFDKFESVAKE